MQWFTDFSDLYLERIVQDTCGSRGLSSLALVTLEIKQQLSALEGDTGLLPTGSPRAGSTEQIFVVSLSHLVASGDGWQSADVTVTLPRSKVQSAAICNSVEDHLRDLTVTNNQIHLTFRPHEVLTFELTQ